MRWRQRVVLSAFAQEGCFARRNSCATSVSKPPELNDKEQVVAVLSCCSVPAYGASLQHLNVIQERLFYMSITDSQIKGRIQVFIFENNHAKAVIIEGIVRQPSPRPPGPRQSSGPVPPSVII